MVLFCSGLTLLKNIVDVSSRKYQIIPKSKYRIFCPLVLDIGFPHTHFVYTIGPISAVRGEDKTTISGQSDFLKVVNKG